MNGQEHTGQSEQTIIIVSNRLPYHIDPDSLELKTGSGGLATALRGLNKQEEKKFKLVWVGCIDGERNRDVWNENHHKFDELAAVHPVFVNEEDYNFYYNHVANSTLWPLFHYEQYDELSLKEYWSVYQKVNKQFAETICGLVDSNTFVWVHDYHFCLLPKYLKEMRPKSKVGFFLHIPFPSSEIFRTLSVRSDVLQGMLHADLVGFHDYSYLRHFQQSLATIEGIDSEMLHVRHSKGRTALGVFPASIETSDIIEQAKSLDVKEKIKTFVAKRPGSKLILGVDRLDYTKGLDLKLEAFRLYLRENPEMVGKVNLLQLAIPTRYEVTKYQDLKNKIDQLVGDINGEFGNPSYVPIRYMYNSVSFSELLALYRASDALLVTAKRDGLNLVSLEYISAQDEADPGVAIVSEFAGASSVLSHCLTINPWDLGQTANTIKRALSMSLEERQSRLAGSWSFLEKYTSLAWAQGFMQRLQLAVLNNQLRVESVREVHERDYGAFWDNVLSKSNHMKLFLDFDGTLAPIADTPDKVFLSPKMYRILQSLSENPYVDMVVISGRNHEFLENRLSGLAIDIVAEHGARHKASDAESWNNRINPAKDQDWYRASSRIMKDYEIRVPESFVEKKHYALVWHYRKSPKIFSRFQALKLKEELEIGLANKPVTVKMGKSIVEVKSMEANKGQFVLEELANAEQANAGTTFVAVGDDETDEDMFRALGHSHFSIKIGMEPTSAQYRIPSQETFISFLEKLLEVFDSRESSTAS